jgi:hemerythrin
MFIEWDDSYSVNHSFLDDQHKELFGLANKIFECTTLDTIIPCFMQLFKYVRKHFKYEEDIMREEFFSFYEEHSSLHDKMLDRLGELSDSIGKGDLDLMGIHEFMSAWLLDHILVEDKKLVIFLKS